MDVLLSRCDSIEVFSRVEGKCRLQLADDGGAACTPISRSRRCLTNHLDSGNLEK